MSKKTKQKGYRTVWVSDVHLGSIGCQAEELASFLKKVECDQLYLVGDIIDGWRMSQAFYWPQEHTNVVRRILTKAKRGTEVTYITGNHDEFLRKFVEFELNMGNIKIVNEAIHETADGRKLMITHGDMFDVVTRYHRWVAFAGDRAYNTLIKANAGYNKLRKRMGMPYWSLANYAKQKVKGAINFITEFEESVAYECRYRGLDGVVCGHIHNAEIRDIDGVMYYNTGDWVESCTAIVENYDGTMGIVRWLERDQAVPTADHEGNVISISANAA